jgi:uncharacterized protein
LTYFIPRGTLDRMLSRNNRPIVQTAVLLSATGVVALVGYVFYCLTSLRVTKLTVTLPDLPPELHRTRLSFFSDFHLGRFGTSRRVVLQAIDIAANFRADVTILAGDYVDASHAPAHEELLAHFRTHKNVIAVLGNHDYARGLTHLNTTLAILASAGVTVLRNEALRVDLDSTSFWVVGLDDPFTLRDNIAIARSGVPSESSPLLLVAHAPVLAAFGEVGFVNLILCGHTHGGQIRILPSGDIPGKRLLRLIVREKGPRRDPDLYRGVHFLGATTIVISDGLGVSLLPLRFRTRPQLLLLTLCSAVAGHPSAPGI